MLEERIFCQCSKLLIASPGPILNLIVHNVDLFESFSDISIGLVSSIQFLIHLYDLRVVVVGRWNIVISGINLQVLQSPGQLLVVLL